MVNTIPCETSPKAPFGVPLLRVTMRRKSVAVSKVALPVIRTHSQRWIDCGGRVEIATRGQDNLAASFCYGCPTCSRRGVRCPLARVDDAIVEVIADIGSSIVQGQENVRRGFVDFRNGNRHRLIKSESPRVRGAYDNRLIAKLTIE